MTKDKMITKILMHLISTEQITGTDVDSVRESLSPRTKAELKDIISNKLS